MDDELSARLFDPITGHFTWYDRDDRIDFYQTGLGWPLIASVIDGFGNPAPWSQDFGKTRTETLFRALKDISRKWTAFYIKCQDSAYFWLTWTRQLEGEQLCAAQLEEFSSNPAEQGGPSFLGFFVDRVDDMLLFTYMPGECFRVSLFGTMKTTVPRSLDQIVGPTKIA